MYRKKGLLDLEAIAIKIRRRNQAKAYALKYKPATPPPAPIKLTTPYKRIAYATSDVSAAKAVLQKLLEHTSTATSVSAAAKEVDEI